MPVRHWILLALPLLLPALLFAFTGPIAQPLDYHAFADQRPLGMLPNAVDVLSNLAFVLVGLMGLWWARGRSALDAQLFAVSMLLTGLGSAWYHLVPDNASLLWDRLPMALAFAVLIVHTLGRGFAPGLADALRRPLIWLAPLTVLYWSLSEALGQGDLRPYLLLQLYPILALTLWLLTKRLPPRWWWLGMRWRNSLSWGMRGCGR